MCTILKVAGAAFVIAAGTLMGMYMSSGLKRRIRLLRQLQKAMMYLVGEMEYVKTPLPVAFEYWGKNDTSAIGALFADIGERLHKMQGETFSHVWDDIINDPNRLKQINEIDRKELTALSHHFDEASLKLYLVRLDKTIMESEAEEKDKSKLYRTLGVLSGIFLTIVLI